MPRMMSVATYPVEILQMPGQITLVTEAFSKVRRVYLNEPLPPIDEVPPGHYGLSVGKWSGDTLVIDTVGIRESVPGYNNIPHSSQMKITERVRLVTPDVLHDQVTIEIEFSATDPKSWEGTWKWTKRWNRVDDRDIAEVSCYPDLNEHMPSTRSNVGDTQ